MKKTSLLKVLFTGVLGLCALCATARFEKVVQIFRNGEVIQEYPVSDIDYIEVNELIPVPEDLNASVTENQITITWNKVEGATYNIYRSGDNNEFTLLVSGITETSFTDTNPLQGLNFYRVTAVIDGTESKYSQSSEANFTEEDLPSGIYLGIYGFSKGLQTFPIQHLSDKNAETCHSFINGLSATEAFTWLYYAVDKSIDKLQETHFPKDLYEVAVVTFTDGLDIGSLDELEKEEPGKYLKNSEYRDAIQKRLLSEKVSDKEISAYTIGIIKDKGASLTTFRNNMNSLATSSSNVFEVSDISNLNKIFQEIANSLSETKYVQKFVLSISGQSHNEKCKFTFDKVSSHASSKLYIEGTYNRQLKALTDIKYVGMTSTSGTIVEGVYNEAEGKYDFTFDGLQSNDGTLIPVDNVNHWFTDEGIWQDVDDEFFFAPDDATLQKIKRSVAIMLNLDCSSSMKGDKLAKLQEATNSFIKKLVENSVDPSEVSSVSLNKTNLTLRLRETSKLTATVLPSTAKLKAVTWTSSDENVATVDDGGVVTALNAGDAVITATTKDGGYTASCHVEVIVPVPGNVTALLDTEQIRISWNSEKDATYTVYRSADGDTYDMLSSNQSANSYCDTAPNKGDNYYRIKLAIYGESSEYSEPVYVYFIPAPKSVNAVLEDKRINVTWTAVNGASYDVYRSSDGTSYSLLATSVSENSYVDTNPCSKENYYKVKAVIDDKQSVFSPFAKCVFPYINGHQFVDLGLPSGVKWATMNVGASKSSDAGSYFAWGEIAPKSTYTTANSIATNNTSIRFIQGDSKYDAATANWNGSWRLPAKEDFEELISNCTWTWTTVDGHNGYLVRGNNGNSIFLPAAGNKVESTTGGSGAGYYWSSDRYSDVLAWRLNFNSSVRQLAENYKAAGISVRPVSD